MQSRSVLWVSVVAGVVSLGCTNTVDFTSRKEDPSPLGGVGTFHLSFREECDGTTLNSAVWNTQMIVGDSMFRSWGQRADWMADESIAVSGGVCSITAQNRASGDRAYTSGVLNTAQRFEQRYGFFEARIKAPSGRGFWTVWWLRSVNSWPPAINVMDLFGDSPTSVRASVWWEAASGSRSSGTPLVAEDWTLEYHVFGVDWRPDELIFYVDGIERFRDQASIPSLNTPLYPTLNLSIATGEAAPPPDATTPWPGVLAIDWVRIYERTQP